VYSAPGFLKPQHNRTVPLTRQQTLFCAVPDPGAVTVSKALPAAFPRQDTQGDGVVNEVKNPIVVVRENLSVLKFAIATSYFCSFRALRPLDRFLKAFFGKRYDKKLLTLQDV
jgi:hypothetical protein